MWITGRTLSYQKSECTQMSNTVKHEGLDVDNPLPTFTPIFHHSIIVQILIQWIHRPWLAFWRGNPLRKSCEEFSEVFDLVVERSLRDTCKHKFRMDDCARAPHAHALCTYADVRGHPSENFLCMCHVSSISVWVLYISFHSFTFIISTLISAIYNPHQVMRIRVMVCLSIYDQGPVHTTEWHHANTMHVLWDTLNDCTSRLHFQL